MSSVEQTVSEKLGSNQPKTIDKNERKSPPARPLSVRDQDEKHKKFKSILENKNVFVSDAEELDSEDLLLQPLICTQVPSSMAPASLFDLVANLSGDNDKIDIEKLDNNSREVTVALPVENVEQYAILENNREQEGEYQEVIGKPENAVSPYAISSVPAVNTQLGTTTSPQAPTTVTNTPKVLLDIVKELTDSLMVLQTSDRTETQVTLQNPPIFRGVALNITEFQTSQGQFQLTFLNLTNPEARALIELPHHQELLRTALMEKGYQLQMVTIEPKLQFETIVAKAEGAAYHEREGRGDQQGQEENREQDS